MTTPDSVPSPDADSLAADPMLRNWLSSTLEQPAEASRAELQLAALKMIEEYEFAVDADLDLACSLLAGNECRDGARKQAVHSQLKKEVEQFAHEFFSHEVRNRLLLFGDLNERCSEHAGLVARLSRLKPGQQIDATAVEGLEGKVAELAKLTLELFVLPQPEQTQLLRERLTEIFENTPKGGQIDNPEWCKAAFAFHDELPHVAALAPTLMKGLGWSPENRERTRARYTIRKPTEPKPRATSRSFAGFGPVLRVVIVIATMATLFIVRLKLKQTTREYQQDLSSSEYSPNVAPQPNPIDLLQHLTLDDRHELTTSMEKAGLQRRKGHELKNVPQNAVQLRLLNTAIKLSPKNSDEVLAEILGEEKARDLLGRLQAAENGESSHVTIEEMNAVQEVINRRMSSLKANADAAMSDEESMVTVQPILPRGAARPTAFIIGVHDRASFGNQERFAEAVLTIRSKYFDQVSKPPADFFKLQTKNLTEIVKIYDGYVDRGHHFNEETASALDDLRAVNYEQRGRLCWSKGDRSLAITILSEGITRLPDRADLYAFRGSCWNSMKRRKEALADLNRAIDVGPETASWYESRGVAKSALGDITGAVFDFNRAVAINPNWVRSYYGRASARSRQGHHQKAIDDLTIALQLRPKHAWSLALRAQMFFELRDHPKALADAEAAIDIDPRSRSAWNIISSVRTHQRQFRESLAAIDRSMKFVEPSDWVYNQKAWCHHNLEEYSQALSCCDEGIARHPEYHHLWNTRSLLHAQRGDLEQAIADIIKAMQLTPDDAANHWVRGYIRREQGLFAEAITDFDRAIEINQLFSEAYGARALLRASCPDDAIRDIEQARADAFRSRGLNAQWSPALGLDAQAAVDAAEGDFESATENLLKALEVASGVDDLEGMQARLGLYKSEKQFILPVPDSTPEKQDARKKDEAE